MFNAVNSPMDIVKWVAENFKFLGLIAPIFILLIVIAIGAWLIRSWTRFVQDVQIIFSNRFGILLIIIMFLVLMYFFNKYLGEYL